MAPQKSTTETETQASPVIEGAVSLSFDGETITGYALSDNSFMCIIGGKSHRYGTLPEWKTAWRNFRGQVHKLPDLEQVASVAEGDLDDDDTEASERPARSRSGTR